jgi:hypothetical protein
VEEHTTEAASREVRASDAGDATDDQRSGLTATLAQPTPSLLNCVVASLSQSEMEQSDGDLLSNRLGLLELGQWACNVSCKLYIAPGGFDPRCTQSILVLEQGIFKKIQGLLPEGTIRNLVAHFVLAVKSAGCGISVKAVGQTTYLLQCVRQDSATIFTTSTTVPSTTKLPVAIICTQSTTASSIANLQNTS